MSIGIYALIWEEPELTYVGQSIEIESRYKRHLYKLKTGTHYNAKLSATYAKYGEPTLCILQECKSIDLNKLEVYWINQLDSINNGLNVVEGGGSSYGVNHSTSCYSKNQILKVFSLLTKTDKSYQSIADRVKVKKTTVASISKGRSHVWLKESYPILYNCLLRDRSLIRDINFSSSRKGIGITKYSYRITSPDGEVYYTSCIAEFCRGKVPLSKVSAMQQGLSKVIHGTKKDYFGWTITRELNT